MKLLIVFYLCLFSPENLDESVGWSEYSLQVDNIERWFRIYRPKQLSAKAPVVVLLHGGTQSMRKIFKVHAGGSKEWLNIAEREKFLLLVPNGINPATGDAKGNRQHWNDIRVDAEILSEADDVKFIKLLLEWADLNYSVDSTRVYVTGASNGGMMTYRLLMELPQQFAAAAVFIANLPLKSPLIKMPKQTTPLMIMNGTQDPLIKWDGGKILRGHGVVRSSEETLQWWLLANNVDISQSQDKYLSNNDKSDNCRIHRTYYPPKFGGAPVVFYKMEGGGHTMPSVKHKIPNNFIVNRIFGPACRDIEGAVLAWDFMKQYTR